MVCNFAIASPDIWVLPGQHSFILHGGPRMLISPLIFEVLKLTYPNFFVGPHAYPFTRYTPFWALKHWLYSNIEASVSGQWEKSQS